MTNFLCENGTFDSRRNSSLLDTLSAQHECITVTFHSVSGARDELYRHPPHGHTVICCVQSRSLCFIS